MNDQFYVMNFGTPGKWTSVRKMQLTLRTIRVIRILIHTIHTDVLSPKKTNNTRGVYRFNTRKLKMGF